MSDLPLFETLTEEEQQRHLETAHGGRGGAPGPAFQEAYHRTRHRRAQAGGTPLPIPHVHTLPDRDLCLEIGTTDDGERWACCHPEGHVRYWFDHMALTTDPVRPVVMWRRHDGHLARYLQPIERQKEEGAL
jgi:hypothetical protein